jgi:hypothetical protein
MALTLVEAQKLSQDYMQAGVIETIARESAVLQLLPFMEIQGNAYSYVLEKALPEVSFRSVNEGYTPSEAQFEKRSESLTILGGDVELDRFVIQVLSDVNNQKAVQIMEKAKAIANTFTKNFFKGNSAVNPKEFDGLDVRLAGTSQEIDGTGRTSDNDMLDALNELLDAVRGGADALFVHRKLRRKLLGIFQRSQHYIETGTDAFGRPVTVYGGVPIYVVDDAIIPETDAYAVKFGAHTHVSGLQNGGIQVREIGETSAKPVEVTRLEWYVGLAMFNPYAAARLKNFGVSA